jgi:hypothetical protein
VSLIAFKVLPSCIDAPHPTPLLFLETVLVSLFWDRAEQSLELSEIVLSKLISVWEMRKSLLELCQVSRVAEEAQLC